MRCSLCRARSARKCDASGTVKAARWVWTDRKGHQSERLLRRPASRCPQGEEEEIRSHLDALEQGIDDPLAEEFPESTLEFDPRRDRAQRALEADPACACSIPTSQLATSRVGEGRTGARRSRLGDEGGIVVVTRGQEHPAARPIPAQRQADRDPVCIVIGTASRVSIAWRWRPRGGGGVEIAVRAVRPAQGRPLGNLGLGDSLLFEDFHARHECRRRSEVCPDAEPDRERCGEAVHAQDELAGAPSDRSRRRRGRLGRFAAVSLSLEYLERMRLELDTRLVQLEPLKGRRTERNVGGPACKLVQDRRRQDRVAEAGLVPPRKYGHRDRASIFGRRCRRGQRQGMETNRTEDERV